MKKSILGLLQTVRLIHSVSQFYNTSERTSALMVKVGVFNEWSKPLDFFLFRLLIK